MRPRISLYKRVCASLCPSLCLSVCPPVCPEKPRREASICPPGVVSGRSPVELCYVSSCINTRWICRSAAAAIASEAFSTSAAADSIPLFRFCNFRLIGRRHPGYFLTIFGDLRRSSTSQQTTTTATTTTTLCFWLTSATVSRTSFSTQLHL